MEQKKMVVRKFRCTQRCQFRKKLYNSGDIIEWRTPIVKCKTCKGSGIYDGKQCEKCKGTCRSMPPHHFVEEKKKESKEK